MFTFPILKASGIPNKFYEKCPSWRFAAPTPASCPWEEGGRLEKGVPRSLAIDIPGEFVAGVLYMKMEYNKSTNQLRIGFEFGKPVLQINEFGIHFNQHLWLPCQP